MNQDHKEVKKLLFVLPNAFTALNMGCGFFSILLVQKGLTYQGCMLLMLGAIFDSVDGRIARLTGTQSNFGEQFDSISDVVSFGVAPALIVYHQFLSELGRPGMIVAFIYCLAGSLRLARFNANISKVDSSYFQGVPIPAGALALVGYTLFMLETNLTADVKYITIPYVLLYSFLMISSIPFFSFKKAEWLTRYSKQVLLVLLLVLISIFLYEEIMIFATISVYTFLNLVYFFWKKIRK